MADINEKESPNSCLETNDDCEEKTKTSLQADDDGEEKTNTSLQGADGDGEDVLFDKFCDPDNPQIIHFEDVTAASVKTKGAIVQTPCTVIIIDIWFQSGLL